MENWWGFVKRIKLFLRLAFIRLSKSCLHHLPTAFSL